MNTTEPRHWCADSFRTGSLTVTYGMDQHGDQEPHFSITAEGHTTGGKIVACGLMPEDIRATFPALAPLLKWHLFSPRSGPMHYAANARYWLEMVAGVSLWGSNPTALDHFKSVVVWGALPDDAQAEVPTLPELDAWLALRLPRLKRAFAAEMRAAGVDPE